jgi:hypothetical protein
MNDGWIPRNQGLRFYLVLLAVAGSAIFIASELTLWRPGDGVDRIRTSDFALLHHAGWLASEGRAPDVYDLDIFLNTQLDATGRARSGALNFSYPPYVLALLSLMGRLPLGPARALWDLAGLLALAGAFLLPARRGLWPRQVAVAVLLLTLVSFPWCASLLLGQTSPFLLLSLALFLCTLARNRDLQAGVWLAVATAKPQYALFLLPVLLGARRFRALLGWLLGSAAFLAASLPVLGTRTLVAYPAALLSTVHAGQGDLGIHPLRMLTLRGVLAHWLPGSATSTVVTIAAAAAALALLAAAARMGGRGKIVRLVSLACLAGVSVGWHAYPHDMLLWFIALAVWGGSGIPERRFYVLGSVAVAVVWVGMAAGAAWRGAQTLPTAAAGLFVSAALAGLLIFHYKATETSEYGEPSDH